MTLAPRRSTILDALVAAAVVGLVAFSLNATAETSNRSTIAAGERAFARGDFEAALEAFASAYEAEPLPALLYNLAMCHWELDRIAEAVNLFRRYLDEDEEAAPEDRAEVERILVDLRPRHGDVLVDVPEPGAEVFIDGVRVGVSPLSGPIAVAPGEHSVSALLDQRESETVTREVRAGESEELAVSFVEPVVEAAVEPSRVEEPLVEEVHRRPLPWWFWAPLASTAATTVAAAITGGLTLRAREEYVDGGQLDIEAYDRGRALGVGTDVLMALAATTAALTVAALVVHLVRERRRTERSRSRPVADRAP